MHATSAMLRRLAWLMIGVLLGLALLATLADRQDDGPAQGPAQGPAHVSRAGRTAASAAPAASATTGGAASDARSAARGVGRAERALQLDEDLHALAQELLPSAEGGDAEAEYGLALILRECAQELGRFADRAAFEAFLAEVPGRSGIQPVEYAALQRSRFEACDGFRADPLERFGAEPEWLNRSAAGGHPLARLEVELRPPGESEARDPAALRAAALGALASRRPEAFMLLLELEFQHPDGSEAGDAVPNAVAWWLLACARGYPCGPEARWRREQDAIRGQGAGLGGDDALLFDLAPHEREQARDRADQLGRALDAGHAEALLPQALRDPRT